MHIKKQKNELREIYAKKRDELSQDEIIEKSNIIFEKVRNLEEYKKTENIFIFLSFRSEIWTYDFIEKAIVDGKKIYSPRVNNESKTMEFIKIDDIESLEKSKMGIKEARGKASEVDDFVLNIMPGLVFDKEKNRIGYGAGYYDKYLASHKNLYNLAVCFDFQIIDKIEADDYDIKLHHLLSENHEYI